MFVNVKGRSMSMTSSKLIFLFRVGILVTSYTWKFTGGISVKYRISDIGWGKISDIGCNLTDIKYRYRISANCKYRISAKISRYANSSLADTLATRPPHCFIIFEPTTTCSMQDRLFCIVPLSDCLSICFPSHESQFSQLRSQWNTIGLTSTSN